jgi:hypothetical protein
MTSWKAVPATLSLLLLASCVTHNVPASPTPNRIQSARTATAFVDQNGTFYPDYWKNFDEPPRSALKYAYSLTTMAGWSSGGLDSLRVEEDRILDQLGDFLAPKSRIFILIHGFNSGEERSEEAYELIQNAIDLRESDAVLEFHWDGLVARGGPLSRPLGSGKIWFNATGYSQLAGARGLRRILNRLHGKEVVVIAHSRGASVTLSAFSDPPYHPTFAGDTRQAHNIDVFGNEPVANNGNRITAVFLAPAIGDVDFRTVRHYEGDRTYRPFGPQVVRIHHTVNSRDPVLRKPLGFSDSFNPTDLGYKQSVTDSIAPHYARGFLTSQAISDLPVHDFTRYVTHSSFKPMLRSLGINTRE